MEFPNDMENNKINIIKSIKFNQIKQLINQYLPLSFFSSPMMGGTYWIFGFATTPKASTALHAQLSPFPLSFLTSSFFPLIAISIMWMRFRSHPISFNACTHARTCFHVHPRGDFLPISSTEKKEELKIVLSLSLSFSLSLFPYLLPPFLVWVTKTWFISAQSWLPHSWVESLAFTVCRQETAELPGHRRGTRAPWG